MILRRPLRTDADTDADPRGEVFGPRYNSNMLTLVGVYQHIYIYRGSSITALLVGKPVLDDSQWGYQPAIMGILKYEHC